MNRIKFGLYLKKKAWKASKSECCHAALQVARKIFSPQTVIKQCSTWSDVFCTRMYLPLTATVFMLTTPSAVDITLHSTECSSSFAAPVAQRLNRTGVQSGELRGTVLFKISLHTDDNHNDIRKIY